MADGKLVPAQARWSRVIEAGGVQIEASFEVFDSGGSWSFLFGKPLMWLFDAAHFYRRNVVEIGISNLGNIKTLRNMHQEARAWSRNGNKVVHLVGDAATYMISKETIQGEFTDAASEEKETEVNGGSAEVVEGIGEIVGNPVEDLDGVTSEEHQKFEQRSAWVENAPEDGEEEESAEEEMSIPAKVDRWKKWKGQAQHRHR
ncbi:hypothetical protein C0991_003028 [Blastosporella zonata]|nr:hypothetical protein C0991_003028 [Blastosporella zonata]